MCDSNHIIIVGTDHRMDQLLVDALSKHIAVIPYDPNLIAPLDLREDFDGANRQWERNMKVKLRVVSREEHRVVIARRQRRQPRRGQYHSERSCT